MSYVFYVCFLLWILRPNKMDDDDDDKVHILKLHCALRFIIALISGSIRLTQYKRRRKVARLRQL